MWETPKSVMDEDGQEIELIFFALEGASEDATDLCVVAGIERSRFPNTWSDNVRTLAWIRHLDKLVEDGVLRGYSEGNAGIVIVTRSGRTIRVLHESEGGLPRPKTVKRRWFYSQPPMSLLDLLEGVDGEVELKPQKIRHLVLLWDHDPLAGLSLRLVAPNGADKLTSPIWIEPIPHPLANVQVDYDTVVDLDDATDDVDDVMLYDQEDVEAEDDVDDVRLEDDGQEGEGETEGEAEGGES